MKYALLVFTLFSTSSYAIGQEVVDDAAQNITWMSNANFVKTSCDANNALWQAFNPSGITGNSGRDKNTICSDNGQLNGFEAENWIEILNSNNHLGYNDWRLPETNLSDPTCSLDDKLGYRCIGSELGHLFNVASPEGLGNRNDADTECEDSEDCFIHSGPFSMTEPTGTYWSGTRDELGNFHALFFLNGWQGLITASSFGYAWPVRPGQPKADCDGVSGTNIQDVICMINAVLN